MDGIDYDQYASKASEDSAIPCVRAGETLRCKALLECGRYCDLSTLACARVGSATVMQKLFPSRRCLMECPKCGFIIDVFVQECPRCKRLGQSASIEASENNKKQAAPGILIPGANAHSVLHTVEWTPEAKKGCIIISIIGLFITGWIGSCLGLGQDSSSPTANSSSSTSVNNYNSTTYPVKTNIEGVEITEAHFGAGRWDTKYIEGTVENQTDANIEITSVAIDLYDASRHFLESTTGRGYTIERRGTGKFTASVRNKDATSFIIRDVSVGISAIP